MTTTIEFTDRYGGHSPSGLRVCGGQCEGMGFYPENDSSAWPVGTRSIGEPESDGTPDDGWRFIRCPECKGTGRVGWRAAVLRVPGWIAKSFRFVRLMWNTYPREWTPQRNHRLLVKIVLMDLARLRN